MGSIILRTLIFSRIIVGGITLLLREQQHRGIKGGIYGSDC